MIIKQIVVLAGFIVLAFAAPAVSTVFSVAGPGDWYRALNKPWFNPPNWIFGPVWTFLYTAMAVAAWLVWRECAQTGVSMAWPLGLFMAQLVLNALWTPLFFGMHRLDLALVEILMLWVAIAATAAAFYPISKAAAWLFVPYLLWVGFASFLNATLWWMNRTQA